MSKQGIHIKGCIHYVANVLCNMGKGSLLLYIHLSDNKVFLNHKLCICMAEVSFRGS